MKYSSRVNISPEDATNHLIDIFKENNLETIIKTFYSEEDILDQVGGETTFSEELGVSKLWMEEKMGSREIIFKCENETIFIESDNFIPESFFSIIYKYCSDKWLDPSVSVEWFCDEASHIGYHLIKNNLVANDEEFYSVDEIFGLSGEINDDLESIKEYLQVYREKLNVEKMKEKDLRKEFANLKIDSLEDWKENYWQSVGVMCEIALSGGKSMSLQKEL